MKKLVVLLAVLVCYSTVHAQLFDFGLRGGISSTNVKVEDTDTWKEVDRESEFGYHVGIFARVNPPLIPLYVQPEVLFSKTGGTVTLENATEGERNLEYNFNRVDVPVLVGLKFGLFRINAGPTFNIITNAERKVGPGDFEDIKDDYKNATVGYQAGVGVDLGPLLVDLKYEGSLSKYGENVTIVGQPFETDQRNRQLILSLGIKL